MIRRAHAHEAEALGALAFRSKAHWGYPAEFMERCRAELCVTPAYLEASPTFVLEHGGQPVGFHSLERLSDEQIELGNLFVDPPSIGGGYGRQLLEHALQEATGLGARALLVQSDPHAEGFYLAAGARRIGSKPSLSIPENSLPLLRIDLSGA